MPAQLVALLIERDRLVERGLALLERTDDVFQPRKRGFEAQLAYFGFNSGHQRFLAQPQSKRQPLFDRRVLERVADARNDFVTKRVVVSARKRSLGVTDVLLAFVA